MAISSHRYVGSAALLDDEVTPGAIRFTAARTFFRGRRSARARGARTGEAGLVSCRERRHDFVQESSTMTAILRTSEADYLALEAGSESKHEYVNGEVIGMAGATLEHNVVKDACAAALRDALVGRPCLTTTSDQRVHLDVTGLYVYPDVVVVCGRPEIVGPAPGSLTNPSLIAEVVSPTTEAWDRGAKFAHYRRSRTLKAYLLIDPERRTVECYTPEPDGTWRLTALEGEGPLAVHPLGVTLQVEALFAPLALVTAGP
jgi:Uma2 family endonuclease